MKSTLLPGLACLALCCGPSFAETAKPASHGFTIVETPEEIRFSSDTLDAAIRKKGYVSGVRAGSLLDKKTGFHDLGFGLDIVDWIMEPGSDEAYRSQLPADLPYQTGTLYHGRGQKRSIEGPQICTQAKELAPRIIEGRDFVAVEQSWRYRVAAPGKQTGSEWRQKIVFPKGRRYFISTDEIHACNASEAMFLRIDMPGHVKQKAGDSYSEIELSYRGRIPSSEYLKDFAPDEKFNYRRDRDGVPRRMIRAYHIRDPKTGKDGPWLAGMTLNPADTSEAWCHQRGYVCFIHEFNERPIKAGESFSAAFIVGYFDSIEEMERVYDQHCGHSGLAVNESGWKLLKTCGGQ